jgi:Skp family chaperone for outer membrane proteins
MEGVEMSRAIIVILVLALIRYAPPLMAEEAPRLAVVNVSQVFNGYLKVKAVQEALKKLIEARTEELKTDERRLKQEADRLQMDPRDPKTCRELFVEIQALDLKRFDYEAKCRDFLSEKNEREKSEMKSVLHDIDGAIATVTRAEKLDLVVRASEREEKALNIGEPQSVEEVVKRWKDDQVLTHSSKLDVTQKVLTTLNEEYQKSGKN